MSDWRKDDGSFDWKGAALLVTFALCVGATVGLFTYAVMR